MARHEYKAYVGVPAQWAGSEICWLCRREYACDSLALSAKLIVQDLVVDAVHAGDKMLAAPYSVTSV